MTTSAENFTAADIGRLIPGKGIYFGTWEPKDRDGNDLGLISNVFAALEDLKDKIGNKFFTFKEAAQEVGNLKDGGYFANDKRLYEALANGSADGKWFVPPRELLYGRNYAGKIVHANNLYALRDTGDFKGTLATTNNGVDYAHWYWSCTELRGHPGETWGVDFTDGCDDFDPTGAHRVSCRPCRVEPVIPPAP